MHDGFAHLSVTLGTFMTPLFGPDLPDAVLAIFFFTASDHLRFILVTIAAQL